MRCCKGQMVDGLSAGGGQDGGAQLATCGVIYGKGAHGIGPVGFDPTVLDVAVEATKQGVGEAACGRTRGLFGLLDGFVHGGERGDAVQVQELVCSEKEDRLEFTVYVFPFAAGNCGQDVPECEVVAKDAKDEFLGQSAFTWVQVLAVDHGVEGVTSGRPREGEGWPVCAGRHHEQPGQRGGWYAPDRSRSSRTAYPNFPGFALRRENADNS